MNTFRKGICVLLTLTMVLGIAPAAEVAPFLNEAPFGAVTYATAGDAGRAAPAAEPEPSASPVPSAEPVPVAPVEESPAARQPAPQAQIVEIAPFAAAVSGFSIASVPASGIAEGDALELIASFTFSPEDEPPDDDDITLKWEYRLDGQNVNDNNWISIEDDADWSRNDSEITAELDIGGSGEDWAGIYNGLLIRCTATLVGSDPLSEVSAVKKIEAIAEDLIKPKLVPSPAVPANPDDPIELKLTAGGEGSLSADVTGGSGPLEYRWEKSANGISGWSAVNDSDDPDIIEGAHTSKLTFKKGVTASEAGFYRCVVADAAFTDPVHKEQTSDAAKLSVFSYPVINIDPPVKLIWITGTANATTEIKLTAEVETGTGIEGHNYDPELQWQMSTDEGATWTDVGNSGPEYTITAANEGHQYRCVLGDAEPYAAVSATLKLETAAWPSITTSPQSQSAEEGVPVYFTGQFSGGTGEARGEWQVDSGSGWKPVSGVDSDTFTANLLSTLTVIPTGATNGYQYRFVVKDPGLEHLATPANGLPSSTVATLTVSYLSITPGFIVCTVGQSIAEEAITVTGNPVPTGLYVSNLRDGLGSRVEGDKVYITGTPTQVGTIEAYVTATYSGSPAQTTAKLIIIINEAPPPAIVRMTVHITNQGGGMAYANQYLALPGDEVTLTATPHDGYSFDHWELNGVIGVNTKTATTRFKMPSHDVYVTPYYHSGGYSGGTSYGLYGGVSGSWTLSPLGMYALQTGFTPNSGYFGTNYPSTTSSTGMTTYNVPSPYSGVNFPTSISSLTGTTNPGTSYTSTTSTAAAAPSSVTAPAGSADPLAGVGVTQRNVTIYGSASTSGKRLGTLNKGKGVVVLGYEGSFVRVRFDGQTGYIPMDNVKTALNKPFIASTKARIPVYTEMVESSQNRYSMLEAGARVSVIGISGKWLILAGAGGRVLYALASGFNT